MKDAPFLDLVICTHNNAVLLSRALEALAYQEVPLGTDWSVLVVANLCTDSTPAVVEKHMRTGKIPGLRIVCEPRLGLTNARLCGVHNTSAQWIGYVDDDCLLHSDWVEQAGRFLREHPDCGALGGNVILDWERPPPGYFRKFEYSYAAQNHGEEPKQVACLAGAGMVVSRTAVSKSGWLQNQWMTDRVGRQLVSGGDVELALRIRSGGFPLWYHPGCKLQHIIPTRRISAQYLSDLNYALGTCQSFADAMIWPGSFNAWLGTTLLQAIRASARVKLQTVKAALRRSEKAEFAVHSSFARGRWAGVRAMIRLPSRQALLGCAKMQQRSTEPQVTHHE